MRSRLILLVIAFALGSAASDSFGHGAPIVVRVTDGGALTVSHSADGYAPFVFGQQDEESDPVVLANLPTVGRALFWGLPGIELDGLAASASLGWEVLAPAAPGGAPQTLWRWDPVTRAVLATPADAELRVLTRTGSTRLAGGDASAPATIALAATLTGQVGFHNHGLASFATPYAGTFTPGVWGFFGRFVSDSYGPSEWFLTTFNLGVSYEDLAPASEALWGAAFPGDYDRDGRLTPADADLWRGEYGLAGLATPRTGADGNGDRRVDAADYTVWRDRWTVPAPAAGVATPEPAGALLALAGGPLVATRRRLSAR